MKNKQKIFLILIFISLFLVFTFLYFQKADHKGQKITENSLILSMKISSPVFENNQYIPAKYTCDGQNVNPPLKIEGMPENAQSLVLIVDDPDAPSGRWIHWLVWNISPEITEIRENEVPSGSLQGKNDFGNLNYGGPCPPSRTHRYYFKVFALDKKLDLPEGANVKELETAIENHILAKAELIGLYQKKK